MLVHSYMLHEDEMVAEKETASTLCPILGDLKVERIHFCFHDGSVAVNNFANPTLVMQNHK